MKVRIKTSTFKTELCDFEMSSDGILITKNNVVFIEIDKQMVREIYLRLTGMKRPTFEIRTESEEIEGVLEDPENAAELMLFLKKEYGRKAIID